MGRADGCAPSRSHGLDRPRPLADRADTPNTALAHAETAYRAAVSAAAEHARHQAATDLLAAEAERTRQRVRALRRHWIPRLRSELTAVELALEEAEHEEAVRRGWAAARRAG
ncbi:V-type ATP synthase subunit D [Streptomyces sanglieri]|uniref:V-type ATP synthase subunit D n=1 Tax=Streptomyces sanglieri TaxID=193460 RepID=A0ABW2WSF1_9ACTN